MAIVEYQTSWCAEFEGIAARLREALGSQALRIDHIGSTAVPGLAAKDIIDVQVTVDPLNDEISRQFLAAGFTVHTEITRRDHLPPGFEARDQDWTKFFFMQRSGERRCNIHVRQLGKPNQRYALLVRDFLRADERVAAAYCELKKRLALALADADAYPDVKDPVADIIYLAAERWAQASDWRQA
ncbi:GrpB family protein [Paucibacter sp. Y2R2-4]|uniref:GrpB family protein n=1 Tax=Paucibacter sp. Y2R2-4 TaxID=2893553 RepID=UPI0021E36871|nr:GrpB family protein [Paucibacter sp. Y2R2-4]MCV2352014.1 GrpB family protein [Paucibacter sp. Y2R2-4]